MALERLVRTGKVFSPDIEAQVEALWPECLAERLSELAGRPNVPQGDPVAWTGYWDKRAGLDMVARDVATIVEGLGASDLVSPEEDLNPPGGRIFGRPDLIIRAESMHAVIDYKTGRINNETGEIKADYRMQMMLYAYLESLVTGTWPTAGWILPFYGPPVQVDVDPGECREAADAVEAAIEVFNETPIGMHAALPSVDACGHCTFFADCDAHWDKSAELRSQELVTVRGQLAEVRNTPLGGITLEVDVDRPEELGPRLTIRDLDESDHEWLLQLQPGAAICVSGLYMRRRNNDVSESEWRLRRGGFISPTIRSERSESRVE